MRVLVLSQYWAPETGVPQRRWSWLVELLYRSGHEVEVVAPSPHYLAEYSWSTWKDALFGVYRSPTEQGSSGELIHRSLFVPAGKSLSRRILNQASVALGMVLRAIALRRDWKAKPFDVVIGTVPALPTAVVTTLVARFLKIPYVIDLRDAWPDLLEQSKQWNDGVGRKSARERVLRNGPLQIMNLVVRAALNYSLRNAAHVITTSDALSQDLARRKELASSVARPEKYVTIRNVLPPIVAAEEFGVPRRIIKKPGELNVIYAGTLGRAQKLVNALEAVQIAGRQGRRVNLRLVGAGATIEALREYVALHQLDSVEIYDRVEPDELQEHYVWADTALVHLTDWAPLERAIPSKTYELMSQGIHITAVLSGEAADIVKSTGAGIVIPPANASALAEAWIELADLELRPSVPKAGRDWVEVERKVNVPKALDRLMRDLEE